MLTKAQTVNSIFQVFFFVNKIFVGRRWYHLIIFCYFYLVLAVNIVFNRAYYSIRKAQNIAGSGWDVPIKFGTVVRVV